MANTNRPQPRPPRSRRAAHAGAKRQGPPPPSPRGVAYDRRVELPRILPLWPHELDDESPAGRRSIVAKLARALRAERRRGIAGHWTYDLAHHVALLRVYRLELASAGRPVRGDPPVRSASSARLLDGEQVGRGDDEPRRHPHRYGHHDERK